MDLSALRATGANNSSKQVSVTRWNDLLDASEAAPASVKWVGAAGDGTTNDTTAIQSALDDHLDVIFPNGTYRIESALTLRAGQHVILSPGTIIRQYTAGQPAFTATSLDGVRIFLNGGQIRGPGGWSAGWTGNQGHEGYRGVRFIGCTNSGIVGPGKFVAWGNAAIDLMGGSGIRVLDLSIEGPHSYGDVIPADGNFCNGIYQTNDATYGGANNVLIDGIEVSGVAQGYLREAQAGVTAPTGGTILTNSLFRDIPGQHGIYNLDGLFTVGNCRFERVNTSCVKNQSADANRDLREISCTGIVADDWSGSLFEIAVIGTGSIKGIKCQGRGNGAGSGYGVSITGDVTDYDVEVEVNNCSYAAYCLGAGQRGSIEVKGEDLQWDGINITATSAEIFLDKPFIRNPNIALISGGSGIHVTSASATVTIDNPDIHDANTNMVYGLFNETTGSDIKVRGSIRATGASDYAVRATGAISEFPTEANLSGTSGKFLGLANIASSQPRRFSENSTSASNVVLFNQTLSDEKSYRVTVDLIGKLSDGSQQKAVTLSGTFYRDAGGAATQVGATTETASHASASFGGVYSLTTSGNEVRLLVNSGSAVTYNWSAVVTVVEV